MFRKLVLFLTACLLLPALVFAQDGKLRGKVTDKETNEPLVGANIVIEGTSLGAAADVSGDFVVLGVPPGVYTVRASYIGYAGSAISNLRVLAGQTTTQDFQLSSSAVQVQAIEIVAQRPLIQRNTTNTVRLTTQEDIANLPIRGVQSILGLQAGVVQQGGTLYIRGGRAEDVAYFIDGANVTNPFLSGTSREMVSVVQEALEEIQLQSGGWTAENGGASAGLVKSSIRTGGPSYNFTLNYLTDDFAKPGNEFLSTSARGYRNMVGTLGGPIPGIKNATFFVLGQHNYLRENQFIYLEPFSFDLVTDVNDPRGAGVPLPSTVSIRRNYTPNNWLYTNTVQGSLLFDVSPLKVKVTGSWAGQRNATRGGWNGALVNYFAMARAEEEVRNNYLAGIHITHVITPTTFYELGFSYTDASYYSEDPTFGRDWRSYMDSTKNADAGWTGFLGKWRAPLAYSVINGFGLNNENTPNNTYEENSRSGMGGSLDFTKQITKTFELKVGGRGDFYTMRQFQINRINGYMDYLYGTYGNSPRPFNSPEERRILLAKTGQGWINHFGYDVDGNKVDDGLDAPVKPVFWSAYVQTKLEYRDLVVNAGLRYEYMDAKNKTFPDPYNPPFDQSNDVIDESQLITAPAFSLVLPRVSFSFPVTDNTVFYAQYGKYAQMPSLEYIFNAGLTVLSRAVSPNTRGNAYLPPIGLFAKPERITQYEIGIRQMLSDNFAFTMTGFYKDTRDQLQVRNLLSPAGTQLYKAYLNEDFGTVKGVELTVELRRTNRFAARVNYTLSDARGTGSNPRTQVGAVEQNIGRPTNYVNPLDYNQPHRGTVWLDYRWGMNEGGPILSGLGANVILTFNSGHAYTKVQQLKELGQSDPWTVGVEPNNDPRFRYPEESVNSSSTPFFLNVDLDLSKRFEVGPLTMEIYLNVLNLLDTKQVINVYPTTGSPEDDGFLSSPLSAGYRRIPQYEDFYRAINLQNRYAAIGVIGDMYGTPRQVRLGAKLEL